MVRIQCVLPYTEAVVKSTGTTLSYASVPSSYDNQDAETIVVTRGVVCYSCDDGSFTVVTPAGTTKMTDLWPAPAAAPAAEPAAVEAPTVEETSPSTEPTA